MRGPFRLLAMSALAAALWLLACGVDPLPLDTPDDIELPPRDLTEDPTDAGKVTPVPQPRDAATDGAAPDAARLPGVFVTSTLTGGNMGGLAGADAMCNELARKASLGGTWVAWLSVEGGPHAIERVTSAGPWHLLASGEKVAADKAALRSGTLLHAIDRNELGVAQVGVPVWTGSGTDGRYDERDCDRWTTGNQGRVGNPAASNGAWTSAGDDACAGLRRLYCFER